MRNYIIQFVRSMHVKVILTNKVFSGLLDVFYLNWIGTDGRYYSLLVPFNETQIFTCNLDLIGGCTEGTRLAANLRISDNKESWIQERWQPEFAAHLAQRLSQSLPIGKYPVVYDGRYVLSAVQYFTHPALMVSVQYSYDGDFVESLNILPGQISTFIRPRRCADFLNRVFKELNLAKWVEVKENE